MPCRPFFAALLAPFAAVALTGCGAETSPSSPLPPPARTETELHQGDPSRDPSTALTDGFRRSGRIWYVAVDGSGDVPTIQDAIDQVSPGDEIVVGPGRYTWENQGSGTDYGLLLIRNNQTDFVLRSEMGAEETILDPQGQGRGMYILGHNDGVVLEGFTFTGGDALASAYDYPTGGGLLIHLTSPTIRRCILRGNLASTGGGFATAGSCGALLEDCLIEDNVAIGWGGGVYMVNSLPTMRFSRVRIQGNTAGIGGGAFMSVNVPFLLEDSELVGNTADGVGAALVLYKVPEALVLRSTLLRNYAPAEGQVRLTQYSSLTLESTILAQGWGTGALWVADGSTLAVGCSDLWGNEGGDALGPNVTDLGGNLSRDPRFWDVDAGDLRIHPLSPCAPGRHPQGDDCGRIGAREPIPFRNQLARAG